MPVVVPACVFAFSSAPHEHTSCFISKLAQKTIRKTCKEDHQQDLHRRPLAVPLPQSGLGKDVRHELLKGAQVTTVSW
eukprot:scaffold108290_cov20-Tisochrysis_lutea.AAC.5